MEEDSYEKNVVMYVVIGEPKHLSGKIIIFNILLLFLLSKLRFTVVRA
jgi:hypothetical protein